MNLMLAQENLRLSYQFFSWRRLQYFLAYIRRGQNMGSCLARSGYSPIFMADNGKIMYISADFGHKCSDGSGNVNFKGRTTDIFNTIITDIGKHRSLDSPC